MLWGTDNIHVMFGPRNRAICALPAALLLLAAPSALLAHHSATAYDNNKILTLTGVVTKVIWVNPHSSLNMLVSDGKDRQTRWSIVSGTPTHNIRNGWKYGDVKEGDTVTVVVHPRRDAKIHVGILRRITLADGRSIAGPREFFSVPDPKAAQGP